MIQALDYALPARRQTSLFLAFSAHITLAYPLFLFGALYGEWFLAWYMLGHEPRPSLDDPKYINGSSWMHPIAGIAIMGFLPAIVLMLILNALYIIQNRLRPICIATRVACLVAFWGGTFALLRWDPHPVLYWWFD